MNIWSYPSVKAPRLVFIVDLISPLKHIPNSNDCPDWMSKIVLYVDGKENYSKQTTVTSVVSREFRKILKSTNVNSLDSRHEGCSKYCSYYKHTSFHGTPQRPNLNFESGPTYRRCQLQGQVPWPAIWMLTVALLFRRIKCQQLIYRLASSVLPRAPGYQRTYGVTRLWCRSVQQDFASMSPENTSFCRKQCAF